MADGPVIQASSQAALDHGVTLQRTLEIARESGVSVPLVLFSYLNPVVAAGPDVLARAAAQIETMLSGLLSPAEGEEDQRWYWAAPILLDEQRSPDANASWWGQADLAGRWRLRREDPDETASLPDVDEERGVDDRWSDHVDEARRLLRGEITLGRRPADLMDVLALLARGWSNREIARKLGVTDITVRTHVSHVLGKLGVSNRVEAALHALRVGLVQTETC